MNTIIDFIAALPIIFAIILGVYGIVSTLVKYEVEREMEDLVKRNRDEVEREMEDLVKRNRDFYNDDDYEDMY